MATTSLYRATDGSTTTTFTWSGWVKRSGLGVAQGLCMNKKSDSNTNQRWRLQFTSSDTLNFENKDSGGTDDVYLDTNQKFRDTAAWYHIVLVYDTTQSETDRVKIYINGESVEDNGGWGVTNRAGASFTTNWSSGWEHYIGKMVDDSGTNYFFNGVMAHVHCTYGTAYQASAFGETDATSGIWIAKTSPSVTYGSQGYFLKFASGASTTDSSGEGNTMIQAGTMTQTKDTPDNNFATWNPLHNTGATMSNGNTTALSTNANFIAGVSTLGVATGKWYSEFKLNAEGASGESVIGVTALVRPTSAIAGQTGNFGMRNDNGTIYYTSGGSATTATSQHDNFTTSDIIGVALDMDLGRLYFSKNGGWWNGASTWGAATPSSYITLQTDIYDEFFFEGGDAAGSQDASWQGNFGNGYFGTTAISSGNADDAGKGDFEYDVPAGYYALCTNNLGDQS